MAPGYSKFAKSGNQARDNVYSVRDTGDSRRLRMSLPPIPLDRPERQVLKEGNYVSFKLLRAVPTDPESQVYSLSVPYYNSGTPESWILSRNDEVYPLTLLGFTTFNQASILSSSSTTQPRPTKKGIR
jgi:hypothetical protein